MNPRSILRFIPRAVILLMLFVLVGCAGSPSAVSAVSLQSERQYLSGKGIDDAVMWDFFCTAGNKSGEWTKIPVPSCWDMLGYGQLAYGRAPRGQLPPSEQGKYRHTFNVPADWQNQAVHLVFEGSMTDTQAWINGQSVGPVHQGAFYRFKYDVTSFLKPGQENVLEVTVDKESANESVNRAERQGDYWNFGGIFRPVYLESRPVQHIDRVAINARADGDFSMDVYTSGVTDADAVSAQIIDADGKPVGSPFVQSLWSGQAKLKTKIDSPKQWTAETPNLYHAELTLLSSDKRIHQLRQRFGFRTIEMRAGDGVYVNGQRIILKGTNRHTFWPESGRASSEALSRGDIALVKEMNNNAIRMSHYPPDGHFLDLCDEMGLYVINELAGWSKSYDTPTGQRLIEQMVTRDVNHPSIIIFANGNENGWNTAVDDDFGKWDPQQRQVIHPWAKFRGTDTKHYPPYEMLVERSKGPDIFFPTEFQHALFDGGGGVGLKDYWDVLRTGPASAGGFIWALVDETLKRPDNGRMDGAGNAAPDGIVGPYREKEGSFYAIKEIWSPVVVTPDKTAGRFKVENRYDFTNTDQCTFTWELRKLTDPKVAKTGYTILEKQKIPSPSIAPHQSGVLDVVLLKQTGAADAQALRVDDPFGKELWTWVWPTNRETHDASAVKVVRSTAPIATESSDSIVVVAGELSVTIAKSTGHLTAVMNAGKSFSLLNGPRLAVGDAQVSKIEHRAEGSSYVVEVSYLGNMKTARWRIDPSGWVELDYAFNLTGNYDFFGVSFDLPEQNVKSMKWLGQGPFRVWKNRLEGGTFGVWENAYNNTTTGYKTWVYPEFKGYYADVCWMRLETTDGPIMVRINGAPFVQVLRPEFPENPKPFSPTTAATRPVSAGSRLSANAFALFPDAGFSVLHGIAPMGTKFNIAQQLGPQSRQNVADGEYKGSVGFYFGEMK